MIEYKIKIIRRDKNIEAIDVDGGGWGGAPLPNIIPKKSPSSSDPALPVLVVPVLLVPPPRAGLAKFPVSSLFK